MDLQILDEIKLHKDSIKAKLLSRFFKTGVGEYGEGDVFWGLMVPTSRKIAQKYKNLSFGELDILLKSKVHEIRLIALLCLVEQFKRADKKRREEIVEFYLAHSKYINNWDLVDLSAPKILGEYLSGEQDRKILLKLAQSGFFMGRENSYFSNFRFYKKRGICLDITPCSDFFKASS
jgi:3-methyladenine DNA glycosylase AlkD